MEGCPCLPFSARSRLRRAAPGAREGAKQPSSWLGGLGDVSRSPRGANPALQLGVGFEGVPAGHRGTAGVLAALLTAVKVSSCIGVACLWR